ncbi:putative baseplate assembly protein [Nodosilinea sp. FACHB-131]|uniref:putative baseplate assembly protein n=1 Tax=Cyanophyceae TaxID=3028117 RepID=UPI001683F92D|nr:putative baseplate assembly protein [Nodosilinea sp. FACHB-131]MBD1873793.1 putative baseplate assembly protein [Nodosilinea sp. FACHB-131]
MATPPKIDHRSYDDIVRQTTALVQKHVPGWQPQPADPDAGTALVRIFGRMAALVSDRLNRAPEKNFLAFLDLIGTQLRPPQPARVPLTFELAVGSPVEAYVPAQTQVAALLPDGEEAVFETEQELVVTTAQLVSALVSEPGGDRYRDCTPQVTGLDANAFPMFEGDRPVEHALYFACDPLLTLPGRKTVTVQVRSPEAADLSHFPITWSVWNGATWQPVLGIVDGLSVTLTADQKTILIGKGRAIDTDGKEIVLASDQELTASDTDKNQIVVLAISAASAKTTTPILKRVVPAGTANTTAATTIQLARLAIDSEGRIRPAFQTRPAEGETWEFTLTKQLPTSVKQTLHGLEAAWLRAALHTPLPADQTALPQLLSLHLKVEMRHDNLPPALCSFNTASLDTSKDFFPLGEQPRFNDTVYIASQEVLSKAGALITLAIEVSTPPPLPVSPSSDLELDWEVWTGLRWQTVKLADFQDTTQNFTVRGELSFRLPNTLAQVEVGGENNYWLRGRIVRGSYRTEAATASTSLRSQADAGQTTLAVHDVRGFFLNDPITVSNAAQYESHKVAAVVQEKHEITLKTATGLSKAYPAGARVLLNGFGAPSLKSLTLGYEYASALVPASACVAQNEFTAAALSALALADRVDAGQRVLKLTSVASLAVRDQRLSAYAYSPTWQQVLLRTATSAEIRDIFAVDFQAQTITLVEDLANSYNPGVTAVMVCAQLTAEVQQGSHVLPIRSVDGVSVGMSLSLVPVLPQPSVVAIEAETVAVEAIDSDRQLLILTQPVQRDYPKLSTLVPTFRPFVPSGDRHPTLYLGFDRPLANRLTTLYLQVEPPAVGDDIDPQAGVAPAQLTTDYASPVGWTHLGLHDHTKGFTDRGLIQFMAPADLQPRTRFGQSRYWLRVRWHDGVFPLRPQLRRVLTNTMWASQTTTRAGEILGSSSGEPHQTYVTTQSPVLAGLRLEIQEGSPPAAAEQADLEAALGPGAVTIERNETGQTTAVWVRWQLVTDFYRSTARDRHYTLDYITGTIQFGDGQAGRVPPQGRNNIRLHYQTGGGSGAAFLPQTVNQLKTTIPFVARVTNLEAGGGGSAQESLTALQERGPKQLRHRGRAVTCQDFEDLAFEASPDVARAKAIAPTFDPLDDNHWLDPRSVPSKQKLAPHRAVSQVGLVQLLIVPYSAARHPTPSLALLDRVADYLQSRCGATLNLQVLRPQWQEVVVTTTLVPVSLQGADGVRSQVLQQLEAFLHPLTGGPRGIGWPWGRFPQESDLYAVIAAVPGVDHVQSLTIFPTRPTLPADTLVFSGLHSVQLAMPTPGGEP